MLKAAAAALGLEEELLFEPADVLQGKNVPQICSALIAFAHLVSLKDEFISSIACAL